MDEPKPKCPVCSNETYIVSLIEPIGSTRKLAAVHCSVCGAIVGMELAHDIETRIRALEQKLAPSGK